MATQVYTYSSNLICVNGKYIVKEQPRDPWIDACKRRVLRAIKFGNNEPKYIDEYITSGALSNTRYSFYLVKALKELVDENKIYYNELLEGYYLA